LAKVSRHRISVQEYGAKEPLASHAEQAGISTSELGRYLREAERRISAAISIDKCIEIDETYFRVFDIAGLIRLNPRIELEVCPKFLMLSEQSWREDFFAIATIARYGRVLPRETLRGGLIKRGDLADLIARAIIVMFDKNYRRPLRVYRRRSWVDVNIDGEPEPESLLFPDEVGFLQSGIILDRQNLYNRIIHQAMGVLLADVRDGDVRRQLSQRYIMLAPQPDRVRGSYKKPLPSRHSKWQELFDLSREVIQGFGVGFQEHSIASLPGFVIKTDSAWESLLLVAIRAGMPDRLVEKNTQALGARWIPGYKKKVIETTPDITVKKNDGSLFVIDAKYKGRILPDGKEKLNIEAGDLYEALAFLQATGTDRAVLLYPIPSGMASSVPSLGAAAEFERLLVGTKEIIGVAVDSRGMASSSGFRKFANQLSETLKSLGA
jgi:hypothetical protein